MSHKISLLLLELGSTIGKYVISRIVKNSQSRVGFDGNVCDEENYSHVKVCCGNGCYERSAIKEKERVLLRIQIGIQIGHFFYCMLYFIL